MLTVITTMNRDMENGKIEIRTIDGKLAVREAPQDAQGESRTISGRAIVFNSESEILDDWGERFREVILPEACAKEFIDTQDIKMNIMHDRQLTLARCNKGVGSMKLEVREDGLYFEFDAPKCDIGDRCLEMVRRGDYSGCSFEFYPKDYEVLENNGEVTIRHKAFECIGALTIGMDPAYKQTSVNAREMQQETPEAKQRKAEEESKRNAEEAKREAEKRERIERKKMADNLRKVAAEALNISY